MGVRVAHLIYGLGLGGLEQLVVQLAARSRARGIDSSIVALGDEGPTRALAERQGIPVTLLPVDGMSLPALLGIRRALERNDASVLHAHDLGPWLNAVAMRALRPRTRVLATFHEQRVPQGKKRHAAALAARATDALVACGEKVRQDILGWAPGGTRVPVIANGIPLENGALCGARRGPRGARDSRKTRSRSDMSAGCGTSRVPTGCCRRSSTSSPIAPTSGCTSSAQVRWNRRSAPRRAATPTSTSPG